MNDINGDFSQSPKQQDTENIHGPFEIVKHLVLYISHGTNSSKTIMIEKLCVCFFCPKFVREYN
jgi:hypothetical protein